MRAHWWQRRVAVEVVGLVALVTFASFHVAGMGDYFSDARPGLMDLARGHVGAFLHHQPLMGTFSLLVRLPFAAAALGNGSGMETVYHWGCLPGVAAAGVLGAVLARRAAARGLPIAVQAIVAVACVINPVSAQALQYGHPEEILTAALCAGALLAALDGRVRSTAVLLGLAWATKQWALLVTVPVLAALPRRRGAALSGAVGVAALLLGPVVLAAPHAAGAVGTRAASVIGWASPSSIWFAASTAHRVGTEAIAHDVDPTVARLSHPLIVVLCLLVPLALLVRAGRRPAPERILAVTVLLLLLRCGLDSADIGYYHVPLLLTVLLWDAVSAARWPWRSSLALVASFLLFTRLPGRVPEQTLNACYLAVFAVVLLATLRSALGRPSPQAARRVAGLGAPSMPPASEALL